MTKWPPSYSYGRERLPEAKESMRLVGAGVSAAAAYACPPTPAQGHEKQAGGDVSHRKRCMAIVGKGVTKLWTCQDMPLPVLPAQEILP